MKILAIDPGTTMSAFVLFDGITIHDKGKIENKLMKEYLDEASADIMIVEMIASYGMPVGKEVFETCLFIGRLLEKWEFEKKKPTALVFRKEVKIHHCGSMKAKDGNIRQALIDRFGEPGTKKAPGVTYGISADVWQALALAVYYYDTNN